MLTEKSEKKLSLHLLYFCLLSHCTDGAAAGTLGTAHGGQCQPSLLCPCPTLQHHFHLSEQSCTELLEATSKCSKEGQELDLQCPGNPTTLEWYSGVCQIFCLGFCILLNNSSSVLSTEHGYLAAVLQWCCTAAFRKAIYVSLGQEQRASGCPRSSEQDWALSLM